MSQQTTGSDHDLDLISTVDTPVLRWYLRDFEYAQFGETLPSCKPAGCNYTGRGRVTPGQYYLGADFGIRQHLSLFSQPFSLNDTLKWVLFHESTAPVDIDRVILWVRADLTEGSH
ncbi:MAG: hypothetical protein R3C44_13015 [Chloroflexota bacterium]